METVIDDGFAFSFLVPVVYAFDQRLAFVLYGEIDDRGGATVRGGDGAGVKVVRGLRAAEGQLHMRVWIDPTGDDEFARGVDCVIDLHIEALPDNRDEIGRASCRERV